VVWAQGSSPSSIFGARVAADGSVLDPMGIQLAQGTQPLNTPDIACGSGACLVVWANAGDQLLHACRVDDTGAVLDPMGIVLDTSLSPQQSPTVTFDGAHFIVVWEDHRGGPLSDLYGLRVAADGTLLDQPALPVALDPTDEVQPRLSSDGMGRTFLAYSRFVPPPEGNYRVRARFLFAVPAGGSCANASQCVTGACGAGTCCDALCPTTGPCVPCPLSNPLNLRVGCGCQTMTPDAPAWMGFAGALSMLRKRRRRSPSPNG
jgi:uncharacterized protein (TIGR03382 family)